MKNKHTPQKLLTALLLLIATSAQAQLLSDGNFSLADTGTTTSNSAWVLTANMPDTTDRAAQFQTGFANAQNTGVGGSEPSGTGTGIWFRSFEGDQAGSGEPPANATITQTVVAPFSGNYTLTFAAGREANFTATAFAVSLSSSGTGGTDSINLLTAAIPDGNLGGAASGNPGGTQFQLDLIGVTAGDQLTVLGEMVDGVDSQEPGGQSAFLDTFLLEGVEIEPPTVAIPTLETAAQLLLIAFFGVVGVMRLRSGG